ncbi:MAG: UDP-glucose 4-epimerase GalE [Candidatus Margulisbacteria bacterium GWF2_35_9]|nr:MAG: UDP-glucose 4-epimerase GalE [Candidatus Margulisbacteria bacterium GWF2_35_9]
MTKYILVAGGAGYIGSHAVRKLKLEGYTPVVFDNLSTGHIQSVEEEIFFEGDVRNESDLDLVFSSYKIDAVMHFCANSLVGESMEKPELYFDNNVMGGLQLLKSMLKHNVKYIIFSSTCATYGEPEIVPITEKEKQLPTNPYGESKLMFEKMLKWFDICHGFKSVCLRYFNASGADDEGVIGEDHNPESHLIPIVFQVANGQRDYISVFGADYPTPDGTCVRDYIHVYDLAKAHILALKYLFAGNDSDAFNLGSGDGYSVHEIIANVEKQVGHPIGKKMTDRRAGDPAVLIGSSEKIREKLGWEPSYNLENIIKTANKWHSTNPDGYV